MKIIVGGHHQAAPEGWTALTEQDQDITKRLKFADNSISVQFSEHVQEHISLIDNILYLKEALRVLKPGGILRIVMPTVDKMMKFYSYPEGLQKHFSDVQLKHYFPEQDKALKELGLEGIAEDPAPFLWDSLMKGHNHRFIWSTELMRKVLHAVGFSEVHIVKPGFSNFDMSTCLERTVRGANPDFLKEYGLTEFDPESGVVEARK